MQAGIWNNDTSLNENEFYNAYYGIWDLNNDNTIDRKEWDQSMKNFDKKSQEIVTWGSADLNNNGKIENNEFRTAMNRLDFYTGRDIDKNNKMDQGEFIKGLFSNLDLNKDGFLDKDEYDDNFFDVDLKKDLNLDK